MVIKKLKEIVIENISISSYNVLIDGRSFYDQPINDQIKKYDEIRKIATGKGDNYATGCLFNTSKIITSLLQLIYLNKKN